MDDDVDGSLVCALADDLIHLGEEKSSDLKDWHIALSHLSTVFTNQQAREESIQQAIQGLTAEAEEAETAFQAAAQEKSCQELAAATNMLQQAESRHEELSNQTQELQARKAALTEELKLLREQGMQAAQKGTSDLMILKEQAKLYSNISNIRWQYDSPSEEIKGYICNKNKVRPLHFNRNQNSNFYIVNAIWDMMEPDW